MNVLRLTTADHLEVKSVMQIVPWADEQNFLKGKFQYKYELSCGGRTGKNMGSETSIPMIYMYILRNPTDVD